MNSLKIVSARVIGTPSPSPAQSQSASYRDLTKAPSRPALQTRKTASDTESSEKSVLLDQEQATDDKGEAESDDVSAIDEKSPLIPSDDTPKSVDKSSRWSLIPKRIFDALVESLRWVLSTLAAPGVFVASAFYDDRGQFSLSSPLKRICKAMARRRAARSGTRTPDSSSRWKTNRRRKGSELSSSKRSRSLESSSSALSSDSEGEQTEDRPAAADVESPAGNTRSKTNDGAAASDAGPKNKRSIRIKVSSSDTQKSSRSKKSKSKQSDASSQTISPALLKSPTSSSTSRLMTKYPHAPAPPRPLIPRIQPSYSIPNSSQPHLVQKTLVLDLDETLIHSLAKGGRMSTGHMVEVKLNTPVGLGPAVTLAPQHPILYYVHKRPHCDEFLRRVSQWYKLVIFTASVQEYADPVIDWLEQDRKYFSGRFYRQHCTFRQGNYIKDLSAVEPDLSKVMIIDNSPTSYVFHEDNALPIEGWINDPTDNDLLHLVPLLEALQYTTDVRALLALRMGEVSA
ncbi:MAG: Nuclear envelope morphology protein 1 [Vezdaea aestivalis]|nr:MAG: Nuclear envelope morphology protein 1 [Vezdaea aestivalis]